MLVYRDQKDMPRVKQDRCGGGGVPGEQPRESTGLENLPFTESLQLLDIKLFQMFHALCRPEPRPGPRWGPQASASL